MADVPNAPDRDPRLAEAMRKLFLQWLRNDSEVRSAIVQLVKDEQRQDDRRK